MPAAEGRRLRIARGVEIDPRLAVDRRHRLDPFGAAANRNLFSAGKLFIGILGEGSRIACLAQPIDHRSAHGVVGHRLEDGAFDNIARFGLVLVDERKVGIGYLNARKDGAHVHCHRDRFIAEIELVFLVISFRELVGIFHQSARIVRKPEIDARLEQKSGEPRHQQRRDRCDHRKEEHQSDMKPRGTAGSAPQRDPPPGKHEQRHGGNQRTDQQAGYLPRWQERAIGRCIGEGCPGAGNHNQESDCGDDLDIADHVAFARGYDEPAPPAGRLSSTSCCSRRHRGAHTTGLLHFCKYKFVKPAAVRSKRGINGDERSFQERCRVRKAACGACCG